MYYDIEVLPRLNFVSFMTTEGKIVTVANWEGGKKGVWHLNLLGHEVTLMINTDKNVRIKHNGLIGFNNHGYDDYLVDDILTHEPVNLTFNKSKEIIESHERPRHFFDWWSYDLMEQTPKGFSLKKYEAKAGLEVKESDVDFLTTDEITGQEFKELLLYNIKDLEATASLHKTRKNYFDAKEQLNEHYGDDMSRRYSNGSLAAKFLMGRDKLINEGVIAKPEVKGVDHIQGLKQFLTDAYTVSPQLVELDTKQEKEAFKKEHATEFVVEEEGLVYTFGFGGLHAARGHINKYTKTGKLRKRPTPEYDLVKEENVIQWDVTSMFPNIMLNYNLLGSATEKFRELVLDRVKNKREGNPIQAAQKIIINSVYGLLRLKGSRLYNPYSAIAVNVAGQVAVYNLTKRLYEVGDILNVNTDGVAFKAKEGVTDKQLDSIREQWEKDFDLALEVGHFDKFIQRDVNNYVAVKPNGKIKLKGSDLVASETANSKPAILQEAIRERLVNNTPVHETVHNALPTQLSFTIVSLKGKTQTGYTVDEKGNALPQKVNRVMAGKTGKQFYKERITGKDATFSDAPQYFVLSNDKITKIPDEIDYDYYEQLIEKKLTAWQ